VKSALTISDFISATFSKGNLNSSYAYLGKNKTLIPPQDACSITKPHRIAGNA